MIAWYYLVAISAVLISASTIIEKYALKAQHASAYSSDTTLLVAIISLALIPLANFHITLFELLMMYVMSLTSTVTYLLTARVYKHGDVSAATPVLSTLPPIFTVLIAFFVLNEALVAVQYFAVGFLALLAYLILFSGKSQKKGKYFERGLYKYYLLLTTILMAVGATLTKYILSLGVSIFTMFVVIGLSMSFNMAIFMKARYGGPKEMLRNLRMHPVPLIATSLLIPFYRLTYYAAASVAYISLVSPLRQGINIILVVLVGAVLFKERDLLRKVVLAILMVVAVYFVVNPFAL
jgi:drug/metabolite transporter (DMT)-like permease